MIYILLEIQNKIHPEMFATFLHISCKGSNFTDSSITSLQNKLPPYDTQQNRQDISYSLLPKYWHFNSYESVYSLVYIQINVGT